MARTERETAVSSLESAVLDGTTEDVANIIEEHAPFEFTARALGLAMRYGGVDKTRLLLDAGATFKYRFDYMYDSNYEPTYDPYDTLSQVRHWDERDQHWKSNYMAKEYAFLVISHWVSVDIEGVEYGDENEGEDDEEAGWWYESSYYLVGKGESLTNFIEERKPLSDKERAESLDLVLKKGLIDTYLGHDYTKENLKLKLLTLALENKLFEIAEVLLNHNTLGIEPDMIENLRKKGIWDWLWSNGKTYELSRLADIVCKVEWARKFSNSDFLDIITLARKDLTPCALKTMKAMGVFKHFTSTTDVIVVLIKVAISSNDLAVLRTFNKLKLIHPSCIDEYIGYANSVGKPKAISYLVELKAKIC